MLRLSNGSIYLALAVLAILIRCAAAAVVATAARRATTTWVVNFGDFFCDATEI